MMDIRVGGIVLCGGQSRRMGRPKEWLPFGTEAMLQRVVRILREVVEPVVVVAAPGQSLPELPSEVRICRDDIPGRGPLQGLAVGLRTLQKPPLGDQYKAGIADPVFLSAEAAYVSSCDVPFLSPAFVMRMIEYLGDADIAVPYVEERHHPLAAVYRTRTLEPVERLLAEDRRRPLFLFEMVPTRVISAEMLRDVDPRLDALRNLNTPEDYLAALQELESRAHEG